MTVFWLLGLMIGCGGEPVSAWSLADAGPDVVVSVGDIATFDGYGSMGESFVWDFGDGESGEGLSVEHVFLAPGNFTAVLSATGEDGSVSTDTVKVTAYRAPLSRGESHSSTIAVHSGSQSIWVVNPEADSVSMLSFGGELLGELATCEHPRTLAISGTEVAVACEYGAALQIIDINTAQTVSLYQFPEGSSPYGVAASEAGWWVTLQGSGQVSNINNGNIEYYDVGPDPRGVAVGGDGRVYVSRWRSTDEVGVVYELSGEDLILSYDYTPDSDTTSRGVPTLIETPVVSPDGGFLYVPGHQGNTSRGLLRDGLDLTFETTLRAIVRGVNLDTGEEDLNLAKQIDERGRTVAIEVSELGNLLYLLHPGTETVTVLDAYTLAPAGSLRDVGASPNGLVLSPDGETIYIQAWLDREVRAFDVGDLSSLVEPLWSTRTIALEPLSAAELLGKRVFYNSSDTRMAESGYITCSHCHPDGRDDGLVWDFSDRGEGLRNTTSLLTLGELGTNPLHWTGNFDELQDFENDIRGGFGGSGFLTEEQWAATSDALGAPKSGLSEELDALSMFVMSLGMLESPYEPPVGGESAFIAAGCEDCHPAPMFTDSLSDDPIRHDVGTISTSSGGRRGGEIDGFDTPTLLGVHLTAPYLHDGSAPDLSTAIRLHDSAESLTDESIDLIEGYLLSL